MKSIYEKRPWGGFRTFTLNNKCSVKILTIESKKRLSLQRHKHRSEFWRALDNDFKVTIGNKTIRAKKGDEFFIRKGTLHRIEGLSKEANILEISLGNFNERDIERTEDDFGRVKK